MSMTIKQAFEKLTMVCGAALKNPFFVQRNLHDAFADIAANIEEGGGGSSSAEDVSYDNTDSGLSAENVQAAIDEIVSEMPQPYTPISYSSTEQDTGTTWTDGRHVYQKTYEFSEAITLAADSWTVTSIDSPGNKILSGVCYSASAGAFYGGITIIEGKLRLLNPRANDAMSVDGFTVFYVKASS